MKLWEIEMITGGLNYYEVTYMKDTTWDLFGEHFKEIEDKINELKELPENKNCFGESGWWEFEFVALDDKEQLDYNFDTSVDCAYIIYEAIYDILQKYGYDYDKEYKEINEYIKTLDCMTTVKYDIKKSQVKILNKIVKDTIGVVGRNEII